MANGAPTVSNGLVISGVTTSTNVSVASSVTATTFYGSGANLTGITSTTINNNADNRLITGSGTANTLEGETNLYFNGTSLSVGGSNVTDVNLLTLNGTGASTNIGIVFNKTNSPAKAHGIQVHNGTGDLIFYDYTASRENLRIFSDGRVSLGGNLSSYTSSNMSSAGDDLVIAPPAGNNGGITIVNSGSNDTGNIFFANGTSETAIGRVQYEHQNNALTFTANSSERLRINSSGQLLLGTTTPGAAQVDTFTLETSGHTGMTLFSGTSSRGTIAFGDGRSGNAQYRGVILYEHSNDSMRFATADTTQMNISSTGQVTQPNQPSFSAHYSVSGGWSVSNGSVMNFNTTRHNTGSHYSTSNYRFTAPVNGHYEFAFYSIYNSDLNNNSNGAVNMRINGSTVSKGGRCHFTKDGTSWDHVSYSVIYYLNASDYVDIVNDGGQTINYHGGSWSGFTGQLLS